MPNASPTPASFATPMMQQYFALKKDHADCLLLFRLGDFYELFLDDAKIAHQILGITLTARSRGKDGAIPMAGVPYHAVGSYMAKLIQAGYKVAICDQVSEPTGKGLVDRQVTRIITPGTALDELTLNATSNNYLLGLANQKKLLSAVVVDISTGELRAESFTATNDDETATIVQKIMTTFPAREVVLAPDSEQLRSILLTRYPQLFTSVAESWPSDTSAATRHLKNQFKLTTLKTLGLTEPLLVTTLAGVLSYLHHTQKTSLHHLQLPRTLQLNQYLQLDASAIETLELLPRITQPNQPDYSLFGLLNTTQTNLGSRMLQRWLLQPLQDIDHITARHQAVTALLAWPEKRTVHQLFKSVADIERLVARAAAGTSSPRQLTELASSIMQATELKASFAKLPSLNKTTLLPKLLEHLTGASVKQLADRLHATIIDNAPVDPHQGGYIRAGVDTELDQLMTIITTNRGWIANLEQELRQRSGINSLKVRFNKVFGFYIEVSSANLDKVPPDFIRKQTLINGERYITPEMKEREEVILTAEEKVAKHCFRIFQQLVSAVVNQAAALQQLAHSVATLDCLLAFALNAEQLNLVSPTMTTTTELTIAGGRHLMVEQLLESGNFIPNDTNLNTTSNQVLLITGPNMAGKSVYMRQVALVVLLAHMGSFVPATAATIGIVDRIFVRSGAGDQIAQGLSTFMVEMVETAFILRNLTEKSLIIMDEIGRGTSTYDGISIAQAIAAYLVDEHNPHPKTLFATHYHELLSLTEAHPDRVKNVHLGVTGDQHQPIFLYTLQEGGASSSFGIAVARLAGLPPAVTNHAQKILATLEQHHHHGPAQTTKNSSALPTQTISAKKITPNQTELAQAILTCRLDQTTPLEALNLLAELQQRLKQ